MNKSNRSIKLLLGERPNYYHGQLLLEDDFRTEQGYHINALCRHNLNLHDWGVAVGLVVSCNDETIQVAPGIAIDESGRELRIDTPTSISVSGFDPGAELTVSLSYEEVPDSGGNADASQSRRIQCFSVLSVQRREKPFPKVLLATVHLDEQGKASREQNDNLYRETRYARILTPGSIKASYLHDSLRRGWLRLPFRPDPLVNVPKGEKEMPPPFRIGATEALSKAPEGAGEKDRGAAGTMSIPLPPGITRITALRVAGEKNEGEIILQLLGGGWDLEKNEHVRRVLVDERFGDSGPFMKTFPIEDSAIDSESHTLALWLRGTRRTSISLVAVEYVY